jgi:hypothetical protein
MVNCFAHATGLLLLLHTGRIRMFGASAPELMEEYVRGRILQLDKECRPCLGWASKRKTSRELASCFGLTGLLAGGLSAVSGKWRRLDCRFAGLFDRPTSQKIRCYGDA